MEREQERDIHRERVHKDRLIMREIETERINNKKKQKARHKQRNWKSDGLRKKDKDRRIDRERKIEINRYKEREKVS